MAGNGQELPEAIAIARLDERQKQMAIAVGRIEVQLERIVMDATALSAQINHTSLANDARQLLAENRLLSLEAVNKTTLELASQRAIFLDSRRLVVLAGIFAALTTGITTLITIASRLVFG